MNLLKENGFYVIGRITTFKDSYYVKDNPDTAIMDKNTGKPIYNAIVWQCRRTAHIVEELKKDNIVRIGIRKREK